MGLIDKLKNFADRISGKESDQEELIEVVPEEVSVELVVAGPRLSSCRELILWKPSDDKDLALEHKLRKVQAELDRVNERIDEANRGIDQMEHELNLKFAEEVRDLNLLMEELQILFMERSKQQRNESESSMSGGDDDEEDGENKMIGDDDLTPEELAEVERIRKLFEGQPEQDDAVRNAETVMRANKRMAQPKGFKSERVRKLFQKISKRTHPDKTNDALMHDLFRQAKKAYEENDVEALQDIFDHIIKRGSNLLRSMKVRVTELEEERDQRLIEHAQMRRTVEYSMWLDWCVPECQNEVARHFLKKLNKEMAQAIGAIRHLDPSRHAPEPAQSFNAFKKTNESVLGDGGEKDSPWD